MNDFRPKSLWRCHGWFSSKVLSRLCKIDANIFANSNKLSWVRTWRVSCGWDYLWSGCLLLGSGAVSYFLIWLRHKTRANVVFLSLWHGLSASTVSWKQLLDEETFIIHDQLEMLVKMFDPSKCWSKSNGIHLQDGLRTVNNNDWSRIMMHPVLCDIIIVISIVSLHHYISLCTREIIINEIFAKQWVVEFEEMISDEYCC